MFGNLRRNHYKPRAILTAFINNFEIYYFTNHEEEEKRVFRLRKTIYSQNESKLQKY
jgi:hypothetical protein